jgi:tetratricopeptide (TPR) repeat protein
VQEKQVKDVDYRYLVNRGDCHRALGHIELSLSDYHRALDQFPNDWMVSRQAPQAAIVLAGRLSVSLTNITSWLVQIKTRLSLIHYVVGIEFFNEGLWTDAEKEFNQAISYNHKVAHYYILRGKVYYFRSEFGLAFMDFHNAIKVDPTNEEARQLLWQFSSSDRDFRAVDTEIAVKAAKDLAKSPPPRPPPPAGRKPKGLPPANDKALGKALGKRGLKGKQGGGAGSSLIDHLLPAPAGGLQLSQKLSMNQSEG